MDDQVGGVDHEEEDEASEIQAKKVRLPAMRACCDAVCCEPAVRACWEEGVRQ